MNEAEFNTKKARFENELASFFHDDPVAISSNIERLCYYFEMACYSRMLQYYDDLGSVLEPKNLQNDGRVFRFKATTKGNLGNFSFFRISQNPSVIETREYDIRSNMPVKSNFDDCTYNEDIVVLNASNLGDTQFIRIRDLVTFCEVKYLKPHPEMLANFIGLVHELTPDLLEGPNVRPGPHPAPSLIAAGPSSGNVNAIKAGMENRYTVNFALNYENNSGGLVTNKRIGI
jgi:hypothetical protein